MSQDHPSTVHADRSKALRMRDRFAHLLIDRYLANEHAAWSPGYILYGREFISRTLASTDVMSRFRTGQPLPPGYGFGLDERCVEYPWLFAQLDARPERILDAGAILNHGFILDQPVLQSKRLHILTLAPEDYCYWDRGISYLFEDLRQIPIRDALYDTILCISTLEHVGADNRAFTRSQPQTEQVQGNYVTAMCEMHRVLKPSGRLLFSVPFGRYRDLGTQQVFDESLLERAIAAFGPATATRTFFRYSHQGWQFSDVDGCRDSEYVDWVVLPQDHRPAQFPRQPDGATAARAVACIELQKGGTPGHSRNGSSQNGHPEP